VALSVARAGKPVQITDGQPPGVQMGIIKIVIITDDPHAQYGVFI
jgi:hypothetical protein